MSAPLERSKSATTRHCAEPGCDWQAESFFMAALDADYLEHLRDEHVWWPSDPETPDPTP